MPRYDSFNLFICGSIEGEPPICNGCKHEKSVFISVLFIILLSVGGCDSVESQGDDILTTAGIYVKEEQLVNGVMETVRDGFLPTKDADVLLEKYNNEGPWKLDSPRWYMIGGHHADVWLEHLVAFK